MRFLQFNHLILLSLFLLAPADFARGEVVLFKVVDTADNPLKDAVVFVPGELSPVNAEPAIMDQVKKDFLPYVLVVEKGRAVRFPNSDNIRHHVYSFSKPKPFEIKLYSGMQEAPVAFDTPGIVALGCNIHDWMLGYIVVSDTARVAKTDDSGVASIDVSTLPATLRVWHPKLLQGAQAAIDIALPEKNQQEQRVIKLSIMADAPAKPSSGFSNRFNSYGG